MATASTGRRRKASVPAVKPSTDLASLDSLIAVGRNLLTNIIELEKAPESEYLALARTLINIRRHFKSPGREFPDWRGRSQDYRTAAAAVYASATIPPDSEGSVQARIRYVINNELREVAPAVELEALGYKKRNQAERAKDRRDAKKGKQPLDTEGPTLTAPGSAPITTRAEAFRAVRLVLEGPVWELPIPEGDGPEYAECIHELGETTKLMVQMLALHERRRRVRRNVIELSTAYAATVARDPKTKEELATLRQAASMEARVLSAPPPEEALEAASVAG